MTDKGLARWEKLLAALPPGTVRGAISGRQLAEAAQQHHPELRVLLSRLEGPRDDHFDQALLPLSMPYRTSDVSDTLRAALAA